VASDRQADLRSKARDLISSGDIEIIIGYGKKRMGDGIRPLYVRKPDDAERLVWNEHCVHNLATYLMKQPCIDIIGKGGRVGIVAKGCDVKSIVSLIQEKQLKRDSVHIIGVVCNGMDADRGAGRMSKCRQCSVQVPAVYDDLAGSPSEVIPIEGDPLEDIKAIEAMTRAERWAFWTEQLSGCIKCYACRQACPQCYCKECITEKARPQWIDKASSLKGNIAYHFIRAIHLAGRCVSCSECSRACPMNIPVDLLTRYLSHQVDEGFDYRPGEDAEQEPFFVTFADGDPDDFVR
jgi:ferredoxin